MVLEDLTDEWVKSTTGEYETVDAWRASLRERIETMKLGQSRSVFVERTTGALAELVTIDAPDAMVQSDLQGRVRATMEQFQAQGISFDQWLSVTGQSAEAFVEMMRGESTKAVKVDLALRAVATARNIVVEDADIDKEIDRIAMQVNRKAAEVRKAYEKQDMMVDLVAQIRKSKAVDWLLRNSTLVDEKGNAIAADTLFGESDADSAQ
jgi:trigger factor